MEEQEKLNHLISKLYMKGNGNRIRHLVRVISNAYKENPKQLKKYFNDQKPQIAGLATSAYHFLTGKIKPIQKKKFGGLGAIINKTKSHLKFKKRQLNFAKLTGDALQFSKNSEGVKININDLKGI